MSTPAIHNKFPNEKYPIGKIYKEPDLDSDETISAVTCVITPTGNIDDLATSGSVSIASDGKSFSWVVEKGRSGINYEVLFKVTTSTGKIFNLPDLTKEKALVRITKYELDTVGTVWEDLGQQGSEDAIQSLVYLGDGIALAGTHGDAHIYRSTDYGATWTDIFDGDAIGLSSIFGLAYLGGGVVVAGSNYTRILRSTDYGLNWVDLGYQMWDIELDSLSVLANVGEGIALAGVHGGVSREAHILRSTDSGATWADMGWLDASPYPALGISIGGVCSLEDGIALAGVSNNGNILRSTDYGVTWTDLGVQFGETSIITFVSLGDGIVLAGTGNDAKILKSVDYGLTWEDMGSPNATEVWINAFAYLGDGIVLAGTVPHGHILRSADYGMTWEDLGQQFSQTQIAALEYLVNGIVLAGTSLGGKILRSAPQPI